MSAEAHTEATSVPVETVDVVELSEGEHLVPASDELLFRQITEHQLAQDGKQLGSHAFGPVGADAGKASYSRASLTTAQNSRDWHTANARSASLGVWAVTANEVVTSRTVAIDDSDAPLPEGSKRAPGHCFVDYREMPKAREKTVRGILLRYALARGEIPTFGEDDGTIELPLDD